MSGGGCTLSDQLLVAVLLLLNKEVSEHGRHLVQYFHLFHLYASLGPAEKLQLLKVGMRSSVNQPKYCAFHVFYAYFSEFFYGI